MRLIRLLLPADKAQYSALWQIAPTEQARLFRVALEEYPEQHLPTHFAEDSFTIGAFEQNKLVGSVSIERDFRLKCRHKAVLSRMYVHPDAAGKGVGRLLVLEAIRLAAKANGLRQLCLAVLTSNIRAIQVYRSAGFIESAHEPEAADIGEYDADELQMQYALPYAKQDQHQTSYRRP